MVSKEVKQSIMVASEELKLTFNALCEDIRQELQELRKDLREIYMLYGDDAFLEEDSTDTLAATIETNDEIVSKESIDDEVATDDQAITARHNAAREKDQTPAKKKHSTPTFPHNEVAIQEQQATIKASWSNLQYVNPSESPESDCSKENQSLVLVKSNVFVNSAISFKPLQATDGAAVSDIAAVTAEAASWFMVDTEVKEEKKTSKNKWRGLDSNMNRFYIAFMHKLVVHITKKFMMLLNIKVPLNLGKSFPFDPGPLVHIPQFLVQCKWLPVKEVSWEASQGSFNDFLIQWDGLALEESSWENLQTISSAFPHLNLEDQVLFDGEWNDTIWVLHSQQVQLLHVALQ